MVRVRVRIMVRGRVGISLNEHSWRLGTLDRRKLSPIYLARTLDPKT